MVTEVEDMLYRDLFYTAEVRAIDEDARTATFVAATENGVETVFGREHLRLGGMDLARFKRNPVVLDAHDRSTGTAVIGRAAVTKKARELIMVVTFATTERAEDIWQLVLGDFLRAMSIGFRVLAGGVQVLDEGEVSGTGANRIEGPARVVKKSELFEASVLPVGADADALRRNLAEAGNAELHSQIRSLTGAVDRLLDTSKKEAAMPKTDDKTQEPTAPAEAAKQEDKTRATEVIVPAIPEELEARKAEARRAEVMACVPESLRDFASGLLIDRSLSVEGVLKAVQAKHAEQRTPVGTTEPTEIEGGSGDPKTPKVADVSNRTLLNSIGVNG